MCTIKMGKTESEGREGETENVYFVTKPNNTCNISNSNKFCDRTPEKANCPSMCGDPNKNKKVTIMHNIKKEEKKKG